MFENVVKYGLSCVIHIFVLHDSLRMCERAICDVEIFSSHEQCCSLSLSTDTFFVEFKAEALTWSPDLTKEYHNTFIHTANKIVGIVSLFLE